MLRGRNVSSRYFKALNGNEAVALAVKQCNVDVVSAYPITPQTIIVERISEFVANGEVHTEFVNVESEHSALSVCIGASAAGARTFTATSSQGLALMWELLHIASGLRLPIVMAVVNRALSAPINIHCDHGDSMGARDSGWIQFYVENPQEAYDTIVQAYKIAEDFNVMLPVMVNLDGFLVSHTLEPVNVLSDDIVSNYVGFRKAPKVYIPYLGREVEAVLDGTTPISLGIIALSDYYYEFKMKVVEAMERSKNVIGRVNEEFSRLSGRNYGNGLVVPYGLEDAEVALVSAGSAAGTVRYVARELRRKGVKVGCLRVRCFRPFPTDDVIKLLRGVKVVGVMDRALALGSYGGPLFAEVRSAFYDLTDGPEVINYIYGVGGRDLRPSDVVSMYMELLEVVKGREVSRIRYVGVRT